MTMQAKQKKEAKTSRKKGERHTAVQPENKTPVVQAHAESPDLLTVMSENIHGSAREELENYLNAHYEFKYNVVTGRLFYKLKTEVEFAEMTDYSFNTILRFLRNKEMRCSKPELINLLISNFTPKYDPFLKYINSLPPWDGKHDHIKDWADTVQTTNQPLWEKCFKKWIVAVIGSLKDRGTVNQTAPVFCGGQGVGKTRWISRLIPEELKAYFFSGTINMSNKDSITQLSECMLIDMDELENLGKKSIGDLKSLMTRETIRIRRPYGRVAEVLPRRASFIGSINHKEFLKDETGSRRFLCFEVIKIDDNQHLRVDQLYSQAYSLYLKGFQFWFNSEEIMEIQANNEQFQKSFLEGELLLNHYAPCPVEEATHFLSATKIAQVLKVREKMIVSNASVQMIGKALASRKFIRIKKGGAYVWAVRELPPRG